MYSAKRIILESAPPLVAFTFLSMFAGLTLETNAAFLATYPGVLLMIPAFIDSCGDISSSFASRLTTSLHLGTGRASLRSKRFRDNVAGTYVTTILFFIVMALLAFAFSAVLGLAMPPLLKFLAAVMASAVVVVTLDLAIAVAVSVATTMARLDPDNFEAPFLTTFSDVVGIMIFISFVGFVISL
ncbi:MAG: magnesium transporter [Candidatus Diapherotrites archaeon]|nr:magnesium transporter [Candidatus Diapherotrites archaeon]